MWHIKKKVWIDGPKLPTKYSFFYTTANSLNQTHVIIIGANPEIFDSELGPDLKSFLFLIYDFQLNKWTTLPELPISSNTQYDCFLRVPLSSTIYMDKTNHKYVMVITGESNQINMY